MNPKQPIPIADLRRSVTAALELLGIRNFLLGIHNAAFPSRPEEDLGRGPPWDPIDGARLAELAAGRPEPADRVHWQYVYRALTQLTAAARLRSPPAAS